MCSRFITHCPTPLHPRSAKYLPGFGARTIGETCSRHAIVIILLVLKIALYADFAIASHCAQFFRQKMCLASGDYRGTIKEN